MLWTFTALLSGGVFGGVFGVVPLTGAPSPRAVECGALGPCPRSSTSPTANTKATVSTTTVETTSTTRPRVAVAPRTTAGLAPTTTSPTAAPAAVVRDPAPSSCAAIVADISWPSPWQVVCAGPRAGILGSTDPSGVTTLFVRTDESMTRLRVVALHEAGHAWDLARLRTADIARWCAARGCDAARFFTGGTRADEPPGAEDWAASWDFCHGGEFHRSYLGLPSPTAAQCTLQESLVGYSD